MAGFLDVVGSVLPFTPVRKATEQSLVQLELNVLIPPQLLKLTAQQRRFSFEASAQMPLRSVELWNTPSTQAEGLLWADCVEKVGGFGARAVATG